MGLQSSLRMASPSSSQPHPHRQRSLPMVLKLISFKADLSLNSSHLEQLFAGQQMSPAS